MSSGDGALGDGAPDAGDPSPAGPPRRIIVTGVSGRLGRLVAQRLHRMTGVRVVGIDRRELPGKPKDVEHVTVDPRSKRAREVFRGGAAALVHLGVMHDPRRGADEHHLWNLEGTTRLLEHCRAYGVPKVVALSSANVYGPRAENAQFLTEDAPLLGDQAFPAIRDLIEVDMLSSSFFWKAREIETVILRPVHILGKVRNAPSNYLRLDPVPTLLGFDPMVQIVHELDVVEAIARALRPGARGIYNIVGPGELPLSAILRELGRRRLPLPRPLARVALDLLWKAKLSTFPVPELDHIRFVCMVDGARAREELGFRPRYSLKETIRAVGEPPPA